MKLGCASPIKQEDLEGNLEEDLGDFLTYIIRPSYILSLLKTPKDLKTKISRLEKLKILGENLTKY